MRSIENALGHARGHPRYAGALAAAILIGCVAMANRCSSAYAVATAFAIRELSWFVLGICAVICAVVAGLLTYSVIRFRRRPGEESREPPQVYGSNQIELAWTVVPGRAPDGVPRFMTDGRTDAAMALRTPVGPWGQPARQPAHRPVPTPRGRPRPPLLEAPVVTSARRRRVVRVRHRVVGGTWARVNRGLAARGWPSHPAGLARANLTIRPHGAAVGRRVMTRCQGEDGLRQQRAWEQAYDTCC